MGRLRCKTCNSDLVIKLNRNLNGARVILCKNCRDQMLVHWKYTENPPGFEERDEMSYRIEKVILGKNSRCACGSGRAYSKCCGKKL